MQQKFKPYVTPETHEVERVLYIALREDSDALRNHVLPINQPSGRLVYVSYWDNLLYYTFFRAVETHMPEINFDHRRQLQTLANNRGWYYEWQGPAVGPVLMDHSRVALLARFEAHRVAGRISNKTILDDRLTAFVNNNLFQKKAIAA